MPLVIEKRTIQFLVAGLVMMLFGITMMVVGTINNYLTISFDVDKAFIGLCASVLAAGVFVGQFSFGPVVDRLGYKPVMLVGVVLVALGLSGIILSKIEGLIPFCFFLMGVGGGTANGVTNLLVADLSLVLGMALIGNFILNYLTGLILDGWGVGYLNVILGGLVLALFTLLIWIRKRLFADPI